MNCKQGDLAIVVRAEDTRIQHHLGKIVECVSTVIQPETGIVCWKLKHPIRDDRMYPGAVLIAISDYDLRPLRGDLTTDTEQAEQPRKVTA